MGKLSTSEIVAGDHIYSPRALGYDHHGIYVGDNQVIHFTSSAEGTFSASSSSMFGPCSVCGYHSGMSGVVQTCLECFVGGGDIYRYNYGVNIFLLLFYSRDTDYSSDSPEIVIRRAKGLLEEGFGSYDAVSNNCEHFALYCKTGHHITSRHVSYTITTGVEAGLLRIVGYYVLRCQQMRCQQTDRRGKHP